MDTAVLTVPARHRCSVGQACSAGRGQPSPSPGESGSSPRLGEEMRLSAVCLGQLSGPRSLHFPSVGMSLPYSQHKRLQLHSRSLDLDPALSMQLSDASPPSGLWGGGCLAPSHQGCWLMATQAAERGAGGSVSVEPPVAVCRPAAQRVCQRVLGQHIVLLLPVPSLVIMFIWSLMLHPLGGDTHRHLETLSAQGVRLMVPTPRPGPSSEQQWGQGRCPGWDLGHVGAQAYSMLHPASHAMPASAPEH